MGSRTMTGSPTVSWLLRPAVSPSLFGKLISYVGSSTVTHSGGFLGSPCFHFCGTLMFRTTDVVVFPDFLMVPILFGAMNLDLLAMRVSVVVAWPPTEYWWAIPAT